MYLKAFINWKQNNWARLLPMTDFAYNNAKNASTSHMSFELNCGYYPKVLFKKDGNPYSRSCFANKLVDGLSELTEICY